MSIPFRWIFYFFASFTISNDKSVISMKTYSLTVYTDSLFNNKILSREWEDLRDKSLFPRIKIYV